MNATGEPANQNTARRNPADETLYRMSRFVWIALTASIVAYFAVAMTLPPVGSAENAGVERVLVILAAAYVVVSIPAKRWLMAQAEEVDSLMLRKFALLAPLILCDIAGLTGLVLRIVAGSAHYYVFLDLALAGMLLNYPRRPPQNA